MLRIIIIIALSAFIIEIKCKYVEGEIKTNDNWAFLARFCFLSEDGQFEYHIEFNEEQGTPNLLLYYDTNDQWPAVYKSNKNCYERELVLHIEQNQIINLTAKYPNELSGCVYMPNLPTTIRPKSTLTTKRSPITTTTTTKGGTIRPTTTHQPPTTTTTTTTTTKTTEETTIITTTADDYNSSSGTITTATENNEETNFSEDFSYTTTNNFETIYTATTTPSIPIKKRSLTPSFTKQIFFIKNRMISCHNARRFRSSRERWWFIAISNCNSTKGINIKYKLLMTNGPPGDYWHEHFSADEFYILPILMAFFIAYSFLMLGIIVCSMELKSRQLLHTTYKIFVISVLFQLFGILLQGVTYLKYAMNGLTTPKLNRVGAIYMGASETCFLLLLVLLAKGYTITRGRLRLATSIKLTIFMCLYVVTYISLFIYEAQVFDPGEVLYIYESPAGYGLICLRIAAWGMFIYSTIFTLKRYPEKSNFYYPFNICGTLWFIAGPAFILSANSYIDKWVRESVVCAVLQFITFGGHLMFLILTMPSMANKNFPYHVRTTQIGIMELTGNSGGSTIEQFGHYVYEPTGTVREQTVIIPLTRRTEEIFEGMYNQPSVPNSRNNNQRIIDEPIINPPRDVTMENVLNWSMAKNTAALELPNNFQRFHQHGSSTGSGNSRISDNNSSYQTNSRRASGNNENGIGHFQDYVRDVPIELFTISRMVVATNSLNKNDNQPQ